MPKKRLPLSRERILDAALALLDEDGIDGVSMRKVASALKVEAMSLYNHVRDKQDLLGGVVNRVLAQLEPPDAALPWDARLEQIARRLYGALVQHPALVIVLASEQGRPSDPKVMQGMDGIIATLAEAGLPPPLQVSAYRSLLALCFGFVLAHTQGLSMTQSQAADVRAEWDSAQWNAGPLPHLAQLAPQFLQTKAEDDFAFMLGAYLNAVRAAHVK